MTALALFLKTQHTLPRAPPGAHIRVQPYAGSSQAAWYLEPEQQLASPGRRKSKRRDSAPCWNWLWTAAEPYAGGNQAAWSLEPEQQLASPGRRKSKRRDSVPRACGVGLVPMRA